MKKETTAAAAVTTDAAVKTNAAAVKAHAFFNEDANAKAIAARKAEIAARQAASTARASKSVDNRFITSLIISNNTVNRTAIIECALAIAAQHMSSVAVSQVANFIATDMKANIKYAAESNSLQRVRKHIKDAMSKLVKVDTEDVIHFSDEMLKLCKNDDFVKRTESLYKLIKKE